MRDSYIRELRDLKVLDGDTVRGTLRLGFGVDLYYQTFRLYGVNAYETTRRGSWDNGLSEDEILEKLNKGKQAKKALQELIEDSYYTGFSSVVSPKDQQEKGKYGRWLGVLYLYSHADGILNWNDFLLKKDYGYTLTYN